MADKFPAVTLLLDDSRGVYIPKDFALCHNIDPTNTKPLHWHNITQEQIDNLLLGPESEFYWEEWESVTTNATLTHKGNVWKLHQDGDLFALCYELMTDQEKSNFGFED